MSKEKNEKKNLQQTNEVWLHLAALSLASLITIIPYYSVTTFKIKC